MGSRPVDDCVLEGVAPNDTVGRHGRREGDVGHTVHGAGRDCTVVRRSGSLDAIQRDPVQLLDDFIAGADGRDIGNGKQRHETAVERRFEKQRGPRGTRRATDTAAIRDHLRRCRAVDDGPFERAAVPPGAVNLTRCHTLAGHCLGGRIRSVARADAGTGPDAPVQAAAVHNGPGVVDSIGGVRKPPDVGAAERGGVDDAVADDARGALCRTRWCVCSRDWGWCHRLPGGRVVPEQTGTSGAQQTETDRGNRRPATHTGDWSRGGITPVTAEV